MSKGAPEIIIGKCELNQTDKNNILKVLNS